VRHALLSYFAGLGPAAAPFLRKVAHGSNRVLACYAAWYLEELKFGDPIAEFRGFIRSLNYELETGTLLLARTVTPQLDIGRCCSFFDTIAARCRDLIVEPCTSRDKCRLINRVLFHEWGFRGSPDHRASPADCLLDQVIERRKGDRISLGIVYLLVADRLDISMEPVGLPGHCMVGCCADAVPFFIDPFDQGYIRDAEEVIEKLRTKRAARISSLAPTPVREVLGMICRHLVNRYAAAGETGRARLFASFIAEFEAAYARNAS
jgi:regulator of sirC expression with transglutaminase-like and TPR domain